MGHLRTLQVRPRESLAVRRPGRVILHAPAPREGRTPRTGGRAALRPWRGDALALHERSPPVQRVGTPRRSTHAPGGSAGGRRSRRHTAGSAGASIAARPPTVRECAHRGVRIRPRSARPGAIAGPRLRVASAPCTGGARGGARALSARKGQASAHTASVFRVGVARPTLGKSFRRKTASPPLPTRRPARGGSGRTFPRGVPTP